MMRIFPGKVLGFSFLLSGLSVATVHAESPLIGGAAWTEALSCKGYNAGTIEKSKPVDSMTINQAGYQLTASDGRGTYSGFLIPNPLKPNEGDVVLYSAAIGEAVGEIDNDAIYLRVKMKPDGSGKMKGTALRVGPSLGSFYSYQCKIKLTRGPNI